VTEVQDTQAIDGRTLGRRAKETRRRLLEATEQLLGSQGVRELKVVDIARKVGTSPATFYQYFRDVEDAVLVLAEDLITELDPLERLLAEPWTGRNGLDQARQLVDAFINYWDDHRAVLRVRNLAAQEGDQRFRTARHESLAGLLNRLTECIAESQLAGRVAPGVLPEAASVALVSMMERMAAYHFDLEPRGINRADMVETVARMIYQTVTGRRAA
jgi:AcrR family transcriptional regulator